MSSEVVPSSSGNGRTDQKIKLKSSDDQEIEVPMSIIKWWKAIYNMLKDLGVEDDAEADPDPIPIEKCTKETLEFVIRWCEHYEGTAGPFPPIDEEFRDLNFDDSDIDDDDDPQMKEIKFLQEMKIPEWDQEFLKFDKAPDAVDKLLKLIEAANFLEIEDLLNITVKTVANMMTGKTPEQIRELFNIECDYTEEELEKLKKEIAWCEGIEAN